MPFYQDGGHSKVELVRMAVFGNLRYRMAVFWKVESQDGGHLAPKVDNMHRMAVTKVVKLDDRHPALNGWRSFQVWVHRMAVFPKVSAQDGGFSQSERTGWRSGES